MENELELPVFKSEPFPPSLRTLDEIDRWIEQDYLLFFDRESYDREKKLCSVNIPFELP
jgi:hypothetical protein